MTQTLNEFDRLPQARIMARLFVKGSEKLSLNKFEKARRDFANTAKRAISDIKHGHRRLAKSIEATAKAAEDAVARNTDDATPAIKAIAEIARIPSPPSPEFTVGDLLGKRPAEALRNAPVQTVHDVTR